MASIISGSVMTRSPAGMTCASPDRRSRSELAPGGHVEQVHPRRVGHELQRGFGDGTALDEAGRLGHVLVEDEQEELGALHDVDREGDLAAHGLFVLLLEDLQPQIVVGSVDVVDPLVGQDARCSVGLPQVPRLLGERARVGVPTHAPVVRLAQQACGERVLLRIRRHTADARGVPGVGHAHAQVQPRLRAEPAAPRIRLHAVACVVPGRGEDLRSRACRAGETTVRPASPRRRAAWTAAPAGRR